VLDIDAMTVGNLQTYVRPLTARYETSGRPSSAVRPLIATRWTRSPRAQEAMAVTIPFPYEATGR